ncbi:MAG TPA: hypothetical protein VHX65_17600 [Pirellulales bacterium]|jgi:hypothetical protein|nr:hypothetical protein [Pirellulales bacterium]
MAATISNALPGTARRGLSAGVARWAILAAAGWIAIGLSGSAAFAQFAGPSNLQYNPSPTLSPYLLLFGNNGTNGFGALNNYNTLVRPFLDQNQLNAQQYQNNYAQSNQISLLQQQLNQVRESTGLGTTGFAGRIRPTGQAATYLNYSHFYTGANTRH